MIEKLRDAPTVADFRKQVEQITGIDFEAEQTRNLNWKDWKNLVHFLETEVGDSADNSQTNGDSN